MILNSYKSLAAHAGYVIFNDPYKLNIWGFRSANPDPNKFDDEIHVFYNSGTYAKPVWDYHIFKCTTDPGTYWLKNPDAKKGTAILLPGQYKDVYGISKHQGKYKALCQLNGKVQVIRDHNRDARLDFKSARIEKGWFGINIHRASKKGTTYKVDKYSAGCQVFQNVTDFAFFLKLCDKHKKLYKNKFTYTLVDMEMQRQLVLANMKKVFVSSLSGHGSGETAAESDFVNPLFF